MAIDGRTLPEKFFPGTGRSYDRVVAWTTLGLDGRWKRRLVQRLPECSSILELASGTGILTAMLLERFPKAHVTGVDMTADYMEVARERLAGRGDLARVTHVLGNAETARLNGPFDACITCYIPKYTDVARLVGNVDRAMAPGGVVVWHDFAYPRGVIPRALWRAWFGFVNFAAPKVWPKWASTFDRDLSDLIRTSKWQKETTAALSALDYEDVAVEHWTSKSASLVTARKPGRRAPSSSSGPS